MPVQRTRNLKRRLAQLKARLSEAQERGESETFLALCRFKIEELEQAIASEHEARK